MTVHFPAAVRLVLVLSLVLVAAGCPEKRKAAPPATGKSARGSKKAPPSAPAFPEEAFRKKQPPPSKPRPFSLPGIKTFQLAGQIDVYLVERHTLPTVTLDLIFEGGTAADPPGKVGLASTCMQMMCEGTRELEKISFNEALSDMASRLSCKAGAETQGVTMRTLRKHFPATFSLFGDALLTPGLREVDLKRMIRRRLDGLKQARASAGSVARRVMRTVLYGPQHPLGRVTTEKTLGRITIKDCRAYHRAYLKPRGARLFVVGDLTEAQVREAFAPLLTKWKGAPRKIAPLPRRAMPAGRLFFVNVPRSAQSTVAAMHGGPLRTDERYVANQVLAAVLGGSFASRLNMNLREDKGYTYGARGGFSYRRSLGSFYVMSSVRANATRQSILEMFKEIRDLKAWKRPVEDGELTREKSGAILGFPARFATAASVLKMYRDLVYHGIPFTYFDDYTKKYSGVTLQQVKAAAQKQLRPEEARVLVVGDASVALIARGEDGKDAPLEGKDGKPVTLLEGLRGLVESGALGKGELVLLDADGAVMKGK